jgi:hypothetical protein
MFGQKRIPTDAQMLRCIYDMYRAQYPSAGEIFVPIDLRAVAAKLGEPAELIYGRLYFDMGRGCAIAIHPIQSRQGLRSTRRRQASSATSSISHISPRTWRGSNQTNGGRSGPGA